MVGDAPGSHRTVSAGVKRSIGRGARGSNVLIKGNGGGGKVRAPCGYTNIIANAVLWEREPGEFKTLSKRGLGGLIGSFRVRSGELALEVVVVVYKLRTVSWEPMLVQNPVLSHH